MNEDSVDLELRRALRGKPHAAAPDFEEMMAAAEQQASPERHRLYLSGAIAAVLAVVVIGAMLRTSLPEAPQDEYRIGDALLSSTDWHAPSDDWLPQRQFDIYRDLPALPRSTEMTRGTLL